MLDNTRIKKEEALHLLNTLSSKLGDLGYSKEQSSKITKHLTLELCRIANLDGAKTLSAESLLSQHFDREESEALLPVYSGIPHLDDFMDGFSKGKLYVVGGRPGMGKTSFLNSLFTQFIKQDSVLFCSVGCPSDDVIARIVSNYSIQEGKEEELDTVRNELAQYKFFVNTDTNFDLIQTNILNLQHTQNIGAVIIDDLQLIQSYKNSYREREIRSYMAGLKDLSRELGICIIVSSQLSRAVEARGGEKRPQLSDLRDSGSIEEFADVVLFIYKAMYYGITETEEGMSTAGFCEVIIAKNTIGNSGDVSIGYQKNRFFEYIKPSDLMMPERLPKKGIDDIIKKYLD